MIFYWVSRESVAAPVGSTMDVGGKGWGMKKKKKKKREGKAQNAPHFPAGIFRLKTLSGESKEIYIHQPFVVDTATKLKGIERLFNGLFNFLRI